MTHASLPHCPNPATPRCLIIDDEPANLALIESALRRFGYAEVLALTNPQEAVARFQSEPFDIILLDLKMPGFSGFDVMAVIGEQARAEFVPIVVLTGQNDRDTRLRALKLGARDFLGKPLDLLELQARVANLLDMRRMHRELRDYNLLLESRVAERTRELHESRLHVIQRLAKAVEFRDCETGQHVLRISRYAIAIARGMGLSEGDQDLLLHTSPLHDVGKIGVSDTILLKPGKLTPSEFELMKAHTLIGARILEDENTALFRTARQIALHHHERWDGNGYPFGLAGDKIPLFARIVALADVFDALTNVRPYKHAWTNEEALALIRSESGKHFDPDVVAAFESCLVHVLTIQENHKG